MELWFNIYNLYIIYEACIMGMVIFRKGFIDYGNGAKSAKWSHCGAVAYKGHVKFWLFRPRTVIYVGNDTPFTFTKIVPGKCDYILTFPHCIPTTRTMYPYRWFPLVILCYPWWSLAIFDSDICDFVCAFAIFYRNCRGFLQMTWKIIANAQTKSHILESKLSKYNQG